MEDRIAPALIDLSHVIEDGMVTFGDLPGPHICDYWTRESSAHRYDDGSTFQIGRIDMVANTGTYLDTPAHRYRGGDDLATLPLDRMAGLDGLVVRVTDAVAARLAAGEAPEVDVLALAALVSAYGVGISFRFFGLSLNWDFAKTWDFESSSDLKTSFWIGERF